MNKIKDLEEEYSTIDKDTDDDDMIKLKQCVKDLDTVDKTIILLYIHHQSMREVAKILNVSLATAFNKIHAIQDKIKAQL